MSRRRAVFRASTCRRTRTSSSRSPSPEVLPPEVLPNDTAAHHADLVAGDVGGSVGGQEQAGVGDLLRAAETAERDLLELLRGARRRLAELGIPLGVAPLGVHGAG